MTTPDPAVQFFYDNAGYSADIGHLESAERLAAAEQAVAGHRWRVLWSLDESTDLEFAVLEDADGNALASVHGIEPGASRDKNFRRVTAAQLALNVLG